MNLKIFLKFAVWVGPNLDRFYLKLFLMFHYLLTTRFRNLI